MIVIGLDLSLLSSGMVAIPSNWTPGDWDALVCHSFGVGLEKPTPAQTADRTQSIADEVEAFIKPFIDSGLSIWIEEYAFNQHSASSSKLAELGGVVKVMLASDSRTRNFQTVPSTKVRKLLLGKLPRRGHKAAVLSRLASYGANFDSDDEADAFVVANYGAWKEGLRALTLEEE